MSFITNSGIGKVGKIPWGSHFCQLYESAGDLSEVLVPYFTAGLVNHERCIWITSKPYPADQATSDLRRAVPEVKSLMNSGQMTICDFEEWYISSGALSETTLQRWLNEEQRALQSGFEGLRISGNTSFVDQRAWDAFMDYEKNVQEGFRGHRIVALCSYDLSRFAGSNDADVFARHHFRICRNNHFWEMLDSLPS